MASITPRPNGTFLVRVSCGRDVGGKNITKSRVFKPSKPNLSNSRLQFELDTFVKDFENEILSGDIPKNQDKMYFSAFCEKFIEIKSTSLSPNTVEFYTKVIYEQLIPMFGKLRLSEIRTYHIQQYIQYLSHEKPREDGRKGHIGASTVIRYTTVFRSIMSLAYKMGYIDTDVSMSRRLEFPKAAPTEIEVYTLKEVEDLLEALKDEHIRIRALIEVALFTGMRRGEIVGLKWSDIDFEKKRLSVKRSIYQTTGEKAKEKLPKSRASIRSMIIPDKLIETLKEYKAFQDRHIAFLDDKWENHDYLFTEENGRVMNPYTPTKQFDHFLKRHNLRHIKFHALRHTSATLLLANGCDIKTVSARLGHADLDTTNIYVHALETSDRMAAETFDRFLSGGGRK